MGMNSELICIGPFDPALVSHYEYAPEAYEGVRPGALIVTSIFGSGLPASSLSRRLASALGIAMPCTNNGIRVDPARIDRADLFAFASGDGLYSEPDRQGYSQQIEAMLALMEAGYDVFFNANG